jgi:hypothetical protein
MTQKFRERFAQLEDQAKTIEATIKQVRGIGNNFYPSVNSEMFLAWCVKCKNLLSNSCGKDSAHYVAFIDAESSSLLYGNISSFQNTRAVFGAAQEDFEGGYLSTVRSLVQAEVFDTELEQAKELLNSGYFTAAAVVAGVVLETALRELCLRRQLNAGKLDKMNADLAKAGQYNSLAAKRVTALAATRNSAAHGKSDEFNEADVRAMVADVERYVADWLA